MTTRESYLKRYIESNNREKNKKRRKKRSNLAVYDDDNDWKSVVTSTQRNLSEVEEGDPDEAPIIAEIKDDTIRKWQPLVSVRDDRKQKRERKDSPDLSPKRKKEYTANSPIRMVGSSSSDLSPQREQNLSGEERRRTMSPVLQRKERTKQGYKKRRPYSPDMVIAKKLDKHRFLDDHSPSGQQFEHASDIDDFKGTQGFLRSVSVTDQSRPKSMPTREMKVTSQEFESLQHQNADLTVYDYHTKTIYRDKEGHKINPQVQALEKEEKKQLQKEDEKFILWGRGVTQSRSAYDKFYDDLYEMSKPFARYAEDEDLEKRLKERERDGDPMLAFIKKTRKDMIEMRELPKKGKPTFEGSAPPNRYGIKPGYRWDRVDRSNGFERAWFINESNKKAFDEEAYKWSVEDM